jgi:hypothetical protein
VRLSAIFGSIGPLRIFSDCGARLARKYCQGAAAGQGQPLQRNAESAERKAPRWLAAALGKLRLADELRLVGYFDGFFDVMMGFVDVFQSARLEALSEAVVFILGDVVVGFVEQFESAT